MSAVTPATRAIRQADKSIGGWLMDLVTGAGSSPSHIIVTGILGVVPGVGQAMDARDLIIGIIVIVKSPLSVSAWVNLVISLIGCVPAVGDALKVGFKLMKQGKSFGRVLEAVSPKLRGNVQRFMQDINWNTLATQSKSLFVRSIDAFIDGLDTWVVKALAGRAEVAQIISELRAVRNQGPKMIDQAFAELKAMHNRMMGHELPRNTARVNPPASRSTSHSRAELAEHQRIGAARLERRLTAKRAAKEKLTRTNPNATNNATKKNAKPKKQKWRTGIPAEHITDYNVKRKYLAFDKVNNFGKLIEEHDDSHTGLDHLWTNSGVGRQFVVGETKSSIFDSFKLIGALPVDLQKAFESLRADESAAPTKTGQPNIFDNSKRDSYVDQTVRVREKDADEKELRKGLQKANENTKLATQMSHVWIETRLSTEKLTKEGKQIFRAIRAWQVGRSECPYNRWVILVTGRQLRKHTQSKGAIHETQITLHLPDNILSR